MALGIIGLPIPDETILTFTGYLVSKKDLQLIPAIVSSFLGSISGITVSYFLGRSFDLKIFHKFSRIIHLKDKNLDKTKKWLEGYGSWVFLFGNFIPGIRHLTAMTAGSMKTNYYKFAVFAYTGSLLWSLTFIMIGYFVGEKWMNNIEQIHNHVLMITLIILLLVFLYFIFRV